MKTTVLMPARAPAAATALARLPVEGHAKVVAPSSRAALSAHATTRSLKELVGLRGVVLHPQLGDAQLAAEVVGRQETGEARLGVGAGLDVVRHRQQRLVAPDVARTGLDLLAGDRREVVGDLQRAEALGARVERAQVDPMTTLATGQRGGVPEGALAEPGRGRLRRRGGGRRPLRSQRRSWIPPSHLSRATLAGVGFGNRFRDVRASCLARPGVRGGCRDFFRAVPSVPLDEQVPTYRLAGQPLKSRFRHSRRASTIRTLLGGRHSAATRRPPDAGADVTGRDEISPAGPLDPLFLFLGRQA